MFPHTVHLRRRNSYGESGEQFVYGCLSTMRNFHSASITEMHVYIRKGRPKAMVGSFRDTHSHAYYFYVFQ